MNELLKISKIIPRTIDTNNIVKDYLRWRFAGWKIFSEGAEVFIQAHLSKRQIAEKLMKKVKELIFSDFKKKIKEISADLGLDDFSDEYPSKKIKESNEREMDWEIFREVSFLEKEKRIAIKEKILEIIYYYAEKDDELKSIMKTI